MNNEQPIERTQRTIFEAIRNDMNVFDSNNERIGHVDNMYFGADAGTTQPYSAGAASAPDPSTRGTTFLDNVLEALAGSDDLPETLRNRLTNDGFIRINSEGLFTADRYALREHIASVTGDDVHLNVTKDELIQP